jgi:hypothetical protein
MSTSSASLTRGTRGNERSSLDWARDYFWSDNARRVQSVLGLIWLLDGALQFQSFMYSRGFIQMLQGLTDGQPAWVASSVNSGASLANNNLDLYNTMAAVVQLAIGFGILYRPTVKPALAASFGWALVVWWFGEAFGMMFMSTTPMGGAPMASALTGAPGAVLIYGLIGAIVWPNGRPGGLLGVRGTKTVWVTLWLVMAYLWLVEAGGANAITNAINNAPSGMSWLSSIQDWFANAAKGDGVAIALTMAAITATIGIAVTVNWRAKQFLYLAIGLNLLYWVVGQGFGGIFEGGATDPNAGLLFIVLGCAMLPMMGAETRAATEPEAVAPSKPTDAVGV